MKKPIFYLLFLVLFAGACSKDEDNGASSTDKLTSGLWQVTAWSASFVFNGAQQTIDVYANSGSCQQDNTVEFKPDGTLIADEGPTKCSTNDPQQDIGTWGFAQNETRLVVAGGDYNFDAEILELTNDKLKVKFNVNQSGTVTTNEVVFEKI